MSRASDAYDALQDAMRDEKPLCEGDARFVDDVTRAEHVAELCAVCPLRGACLQYARAAHPTGGIWAGQRWGQTRTTKEAA